MATPSPKKQPGPNHAHQKAHGGSKPPIFEEYVSESRADELVASGQAVMGPLRVAANNYGICFISGGVNGRDICVPSFEMRNRAMDGDVVVVEKLPRALWKINEKEAAKLGINVYREDQEPVLSTSASLVDVEQFLAKLTLEPRELFVEPTGTTIVALSSFADLDHLLAKAAALAGPIFERKQQTKNPLDLPDTVVQTSGKVVFIKEALHPRIALGTLERTATMLRFVTRDRRFPYLFVPDFLVPPDLKAMPELPKDLLMTCTMGTWAVTSRLPRAAELEIIGKTTDLAACSRALLRKNKINIKPFTDAECSTLPPAPWAPSPDEIAKRRDFRDTLVFSIDPPTTRDVDDALSIVALDDGSFEIGVHIADVSHFVKPDTALDAAARSRATTTYMINECFPMLPRMLCDNLCSLIANVDRYSFSVLFHMRPGEQPRAVWMGKSIIRSAAKLSYDHAQSVISRTLDLPFPPINAPHTLSAVHTAIGHLHLLAQQLRAERFKAGALGLSNAALHFDLDATGIPSTAQPAEHNEAHELIEEFMLLVNIAVATRLFTEVPVGAMLRKHPHPDEGSLETLAALCTRLSVEFDASSSLGLSQSLQHCPPDIRAALTQRLTRSMKLAAYFSSDGNLDDAMHFGLHVPLYTHFSSPIRRYADLIVHRQLHALLTGAPPPLPADVVARIANQCNDRNKAAGNAQDEEEKLYLNAYLAAQPAPCVRDAVVIAVLDRSFEVYVAEYNLSQRIDCDFKLYGPFTYNEETDTLRFSPPKGHAFVIKMFMPVRVELKVEGVGLDSKITAVLLPPAAAAADERQGHVTGQL